MPYTKVQQVAVSPATPLGTLITNTVFGSGIDIGPDGVLGQVLINLGPPPAFNFDDTPVNAQAEATVLVDRIADVAVTKSDQLTVGAAGGPVTYTITVTNNGPDPARNVKVTSK
ncbi:MAG: hypothetical protein ACUVSQ_08390 [Pseudanabaenaceae cyanobacterium]